MKYLVIIEKGEHNLAAYVPDLPGCVSAGDDLCQVMQNIQEAIAGHLELMYETGEVIPESTCTGVDVHVRDPRLGRIHQFIDDLLDRKYHGQTTGDEMYDRLKRIPRDIKGLLVEMTKINPAPQ